MHWWIRGLFCLMAFLAIFLVGEVRIMDMSCVVGHELWLVLGRSVSPKQKSSCLSWEPRPWRPISSIFTASFNESYQNWDKIQGFLGWLPTFPWLADFVFSLLQMSCLHCWTEHCAGNPGKGRELHPLECKRLIANEDNTQVTRRQACNRLWYQWEWKDNLIPGFPGWCGACGFLYPQKAAHWPGSEVLLTRFVCDILEKIEEYFEYRGPGYFLSLDWFLLPVTSAALSPGAIWGTTRVYPTGCFCWKRGMCCHSLKLLLCIGNQTRPAKEVSLLPQGRSQSSCLNLASHLYSISFSNRKHCPRL